MMNFFRNLGFGNLAKPQAAGYDQYAAGVPAPPTDGYDQFGDYGGYEDATPQYEQFGTYSAATQNPSPGKKRKAPSAKSMLAAAAKLGQPADITQGMPAATPFRLTGGLLR